MVCKDSRPSFWLLAIDFKVPHLNHQKNAVLVRPDFEGLPGRRKEWYIESNSVGSTRVPGSKTAKTEVTPLPQRTEQGTKLCSPRGRAEGQEEVEVIRCGKTRRWKAKGKR